LSSTRERSCGTRLFDEVFARGETAREIVDVNIPDPPRYRFKKSTDFELILDLGRAEGVEIELPPFSLTISSRR
jgi:hypothetical protein